MGQIYTGIHEPAALKLRDALGLKAFVETGTYHGVTAKWAADKFDTVISIDIAFGYIESAKNSIKNPNVRFIAGDTREVLPRICNELSEVPTLFWLDAHSVGTTATYDPKGNPLEDEINAINNNFSGAHAIMVDDYWLFVKTDQSPLMIPLRSEGKNDREIIVLDDVLIACKNMPELR